MRVQCMNTEKGEEFYRKTSKSLFCKENISRGMPIPCYICVKVFAEGT